jgi:hypothetical protein
MKRRRPGPPAEQPVEIIMSVELSNGHFRSTLRQPINAPSAEKQAMVEKWLEMIRFGLAQGVTAMDAAFAPSDGSGASSRQP